MQGDPDSLEHVEEATPRATTVRRPPRARQVALVAALPLAACLAAAAPAGGMPPHAEAAASAAITRDPPHVPVIAPPLLAAASTWSSAPRSGRPPGNLLPVPRRELVDAYERASAAVRTTCDLDPTVLAAMAQVASGSLRGRSVDTDGRVRPVVVGEDRGAADTDGGAIDGDARADHAVGPFGLPVPVWVAHRLDGDGDGTRDPQDLVDAATSTAYLLCTAGDREGRRPDVALALRSIWRSGTYVATVLAWQQAYAGSALLRPWVSPPPPVVVVSWSRPAEVPAPRQVTARVVPTAPPSPVARPVPAPVPPVPTPAAPQVPAPSVLPEVPTTSEAPQVPELPDPVEMPGTPETPALPDPTETPDACATPAPDALAPSPEVDPVPATEPTTEPTTDPTTDPTTEPVPPSCQPAASETPAIPGDDGAGAALDDATPAP